MLKFTCPTGSPQIHSQRDIAAAKKSQAALKDPAYSLRRPGQLEPRSSSQRVDRRREPQHSQVKPIQANDFLRHAMKLEDGTANFVAPRKTSQTNL